MPHLAVPAIEHLRVHTVDMPHQPRKIRLPGVKHEVIVIAHQAVGQHLGIEVQHALGHDRQQGFAVGIVHEDRLAPVASGSDVTDHAGEFDAERSGHGLGKLRG